MYFYVYDLMYHLIMVVNVGVFVNMVQHSPLETQLCSGGTCCIRVHGRGGGCTVQSRAEQFAILM